MLNAEAELLRESLSYLFNTKAFSGAVSIFGQKPPGRQSTLQETDLTAYGFE